MKDNERRTGNVAQENVAPLFWEVMRWLIEQASPILDVLRCELASFKQFNITHPYLCFIPAKLFDHRLVWCVCGFVFSPFGGEFLNDCIHELFD